jgi:hypothetical protein
MVDDEPRNPERPERRRSGNGGGSGLGKLIPLALMFLVKKPKLLIPILIIGAFLYFGKGCFGGGAADSDDQSGLLEKLFRGAELSEEQYDKAEVFEPLADNGKNPLPSKVSLEEFCPRRLNQGYQGSCVGWASSYAARTILEARATGKNPNAVAFSPSSLYNQISLPNCQGAYIINAMKVMEQRGVLPYHEFPYNQNDCDRLPSRSQMQLASEHRTKGFNRLSRGGSNYGVNLLAIKQNLAQGAPVVIGMMVGNSFMQAMNGRSVWSPSRSDYNMRNFGGHAMCVVGYDDRLNGGSFRIMNSWGEEWGEKGFCWVSYRDFNHFVKEAYGLYPMGNSKKLDPSVFEVKFGLVKNSNSSYIGLEWAGENVFVTEEKVAKGERFKVEVTNTVACYTYVFGQETDGSSYVLFPYTPKYSAYCGITGTRVFPRDKSLMPDEVGQQDVMAIVVSKQPLDYMELNRRLNAATGNYQQKMDVALADLKQENVEFNAERGAFGFRTRTDGNHAVAMILAINKQ